MKQIPNSLGPWRAKDSPLSVRIGTAFVLGLFIVSQGAMAVKFFVGFGGRLLFSGANQYPWLALLPVLFGLLCILGVVALVWFFRR